MWKSDGCVEHSPHDALETGGRGEGPFVPEEMIEVLGEHGAHVNVRDGHGLACRGRVSIEWDPVSEFICNVAFYGFRAVMNALCVQHWWSHV